MKRRDPDYRVRIRRDLSGDLIVTVWKGWRLIGRRDTLKKRSPDNYAFARSVADVIIERDVVLALEHETTPKRYKVSAVEARNAALEKDVLDAA